jgi:hypothetical protein
MYAGSRARNECPISGFQQILLDGAAWTARFPVGKHTLAAQFQSCKFAGPMQDLLLNGSVEMVYEMSDIENVSAVLTFRQFTADLGLVAEGPATYVLEKSAQAERMLVDLRAGAALTNPETTKRVDFLSGRYSWTIDRAEPKREILEYAGVTLDLNGVRYVISGRQTYLGSRGDCEEGEIRITDGNGALVGRQYCAAGRSKYEVLKSIPSFW